MLIDLNSDMGESFGAWRLGCDEELARHITSANLACGFHAADPMVMTRASQACARHNVAIGAHPAYPDLRGFGRRDMDISPAELKADLIYQIGALKAIARTVGAELQHVKPHGALYNKAMKDETTAAALVEALSESEPGLILVTLAGPGGEMLRARAAGAGLVCASEAFADRAYTPEGRLVNRKEPGAVIHDPAAVTERCLQMAEGTVTSADGGQVELGAHTICVHGDSPGAVALVEAIGLALQKAGHTLAPLARVLGQGS